MTGLTDRGKAFRAAIAEFIGNKLKKPPKGGDGTYAAANDAECEDWLRHAAANIGNASIATHPVRITHSSIKGASSIYAAPNQLMARPEIGTHSVIGPFTTDFAIGNSPEVPACQFLQQSLQDKSFASWLAADDPDLVAALYASVGGDVTVVEKFIYALKPQTRAISSSLAKQVYWLAKELPQDDSHYHLLQPMFSSTLENAVHEPLRSVTDAFFKARGTQKNKPTFADHATYPGLVRKNIGGANPQNVSPLNSVRHGNNYLLTSLPPAAWKPHEGADPLKLDTVFQEKRGALFFSGEVRASIRELVDFLKTDPERNRQTRERVQKNVRAIATEVALFGAAMRGRHPAGWTRDGACRLPLCEQLWLDPERTELPLRNDPEHPHWGEDDAAFNAAYQRGDWADEVAGRFGRWLNQQLRERSDTLVALGDPETRYFASESILEVSWPMPQQRRAGVGAA